MTPSQRSKIFRQCEKIFHRRSKALKFSTENDIKNQLQRLNDDIAKLAHMLAIALPNANESECF